MRSSRVVKSQQVCAIPAGGDRGCAPVAIKNAVKVAQDRRAKAGILVGWLLAFVFVLLGRLVVGILLTGCDVCCVSVASAAGRDIDEATAWRRLRWRRRCMMVAL